MLAVVGTVPDPDLPIVTGEARMIDHHIVVGPRRFAIHRGTPALIAAALAVSCSLGQPAPEVYLAGDIGLGSGSRRLYDYLCRNMACIESAVMVFHYLQPDVDWHNRVLFAIQALPRTPTLIADAGFMYAAKMSGQADAYDLFTPDLGELSFLADEQAPHPFYTRGFILHMEDRTEEMIARAYRFHNAARHLLVKGKRDIIVNGRGIQTIIDSPNVPTLEPIGGTGDTVTGIAAALAASGMPIPEAAEAAAKINRVAGFLSNPTPATQVSRIIDCLPEAIRQILGHSLP